jgi:signal transduction histidine kinase
VNGWSTALSLSFRTKVFLLVAGAALLIVAPALFLIAHAVEGRVYERAVEELDRASEVLALNWALQDTVLLGEVRVRALDVRLTEPLLERDGEATGRVLARTLSDDRLALAADSVGETVMGPELDPAMLWRSAGRGSIVARPQAGGAPLRVAIWPVWSEGRVAGLIGIGTTLDERTARRLQELTGNHIALVVSDSVVATTLPDSVAVDLEGIDMPTRIARGGTVRRELGGLPFLYTVQHLPARGEPAAVLLFQPVAQELRVAGGIRQSLLLIGLAALGLALVLAGLISRIVARPAQELAVAAEGLAEGRYDVPLPSASRDEIGRLAAAFGEMRSAIAEREARLRSTQAELVHREKLAAMGRLVAQLSHEINNPIYNIQTCLETLARRGDPDDPNREFLVLAQEELTRMAGLTGRLLAHSRPLSDALTRVDPNQLVERVATLAADEAAARNIELKLDLDESLPEVVAHPGAIHEVLANLIDNAMDAMPEGGTATLATRTRDGQVLLEVGDTGHGIPQEDRARIFEAFYTTKPGAHGVGLGLFVSEGIVRGHRGEMRVESAPGKGSRFIVALPVEPGSDGTPGHTDSDAPAGAGTEVEDRE